MTKKSESQKESQSKKNLRVLKKYPKISKRVQKSRKKSQNLKNNPGILKKIPKKTPHEKSQI